MNLNEKRTCEDLVRPPRWAVARWAARGVAAALAGWPLLMGAAEVTNVLVTAVRPAETSVFLRASWPAEDSLPTHSVEVFAKGDLNAASWTRVGTGEVYERDSDIEVPQSAWPEEWKSVFFVLGLALDTDGDGLSDSFERFVSKTDAAKADTDGDGMPDGWEFDCGFDPMTDDASGDRDGDGLANGFEYAQGTDPGNADTDGDGLGDGTETGRLSVGAGDAVPWFELEDGASVVAAADQTSGLYAFDLPFETSLAGDCVDRALVDIRGVVYFGDAKTTAGLESVAPQAMSGSLGNACAAVAGYWSALCLHGRAGEEPARVRVGTGRLGTNEYFVVSYERIGTTKNADDEISFQISLPRNAPDVACVRYRTVVDARSGYRVSIGAQGGKDDAGRARPALSHFYGVTPANVAAGETIVYRFGCGGDPLKADTDGDGLDDGDEVAAGTNPVLSDTDGDGMPDAWEIENGLDPLSSAGEDGATGDLDGDNLVNVREYEYETDPNDADGDGDGIADGAETGYIAIGNPLPWLAFDACEDLTADLLDAGYAKRYSVTRALPETLNVQGTLVDTITLNSRGWLFLNRIGYENKGHAYGDLSLDSAVDANALAIAAYGDDRMIVYTNLADRASRVRLGAASYAGTRYLLVEYENMYLGKPAGETNSISWQVAFPIGDASAVQAKVAAAKLCGAGADAPQVPVGYVSYKDVTGTTVTNRYGTIGMQTMGGRNCCEMDHDTGDGFGSWMKSKLTMFFGSNSSPRAGDTDGDGISDAEERELGTDPGLADTDGDGMPDGWERDNGLDPKSKDESQDADGDGVSNEKEYMSGTNPCSDDSDGDKLKDNDELAYGTDPLRADTDWDELSDYEEIMTHHTDPLYADTDRDGLTDAWEVRHKLDPLDATGENGATGDPDQDGLDNIHEYMNNTDPRDDDTDNDNVKDGEEVAQGSDPADATSKDKPDTSLFRNLVFGVDGDFAAWEMTIQGLDADDKRLRRLTMALPADQQVTNLLMRKGCAYAVTMRWLNCDGHTEDEAPWYCWRAQIDGYPKKPTYLDYSRKRWDRLQVVAGPGWIAENADGLLTTHVHLCANLGQGRSGGGNLASGLKATVYVLFDPTVTPDYDRDRRISDEEVARSDSANSAFHFWLNDDLDDEDKGDNDCNGDRPRNNDSAWNVLLEPFDAFKTLNYDDEIVNGPCDILDFTPVLLDNAKVFNRDFPDSVAAYIRNDIVWRLKSDVVNAVFTRLSAANAGSFQISECGQCGEELNQAIENAGVTELDDGCDLPKGFSDHLSEAGGKGVIAVEGCELGRGLKFQAVTREEGIVVAERDFDFVVRDVQDYYGFGNVRGAEEDEDMAVEIPKIACQKDPRDAIDRDLIHVHGFHVGIGDARAWFAELYKRFWQTGMKARFWGVTWHGDARNFEYTWSALDMLHYQRGVKNAFTSAAAYRRVVEGIQSNVTKRVVMAHSLGNMLVSEALRQQDVGNCGKFADEYFLMNPAVPSEAYLGALHEQDVTRTLYTETNIVGCVTNIIPHSTNVGMVVRYVPTEWQAYTNLCWSANWHKLFPEDDRRWLTWKNLFTNSLNAVNSNFCYYSSLDQLFVEYKVMDANGFYNETTPTLTSNWFDGEKNVEANAWQKSEICKGVWVSAGSGVAGWGFHCWSVVERNADGSGVVHSEHYTPAQAAALCESGAIVNKPVFSWNLKTMFKPTLTRAEINYALAYGIPAISSSAGLNGVRAPGVGNLDENAELVRSKDNWPRKLKKDWLHSDWKDVAYRYIYKLFDKIVNETGRLK